MRDPFPFWPLALSIATGMLIANAVTWFAAETRLRYELYEATRALNEDARRREAESVKRQQAAAAVEAQKLERAQRQQAERISEQRKAATAAAERAERHRLAIERDEREGEYFQPASDELAIGTFACKDRQIVVRSATGWDLTFKGDGTTARCRTER